MANLQKLKEQARALVQGGQLQAALELFERAAREGSPDRVEPDVWVQLGGLQRRAGREPEALASYERAATALANAELRNCALAVCRRILEIDADRAGAYLRMGELAAALGYARDARHGYLEFADRVVRRGDPAAALDALRAYLGHFPDDAAARRLLVDAFVSEGQPGQAVAELQSLEALLRRRGALAAAAQVGQEIESLRRESGLEIPPLPADPPAPPPLGLLADEPGTAPAPAPDRPDTAERLDLEPTLIPTGLDDSAVEVRPLEGLEPTLSRMEPDQEEESADALPLLGVEHAAGVEPRPLWSAGDEADDPEPGDDDLEPLPLLGTGFEETRPLPQPGLRDRLAERIAEQPEDLDAWRRLIALLRESGEREELAAALRRAHPHLAGAGHPDEAADVMEWLGELQPLTSAELQTRVDYAARAADPQRTQRALLALAGGLLAERDLAGADAVFRRVLELDPDNLEAQRALHAQAPGSPRGGEDYVDLGALILEEEAESMTPLPVRRSPADGGADDFDDVLALFGASGEEPVSPQDASSHYDLGLAFMEMGLLNDAVAQLQIALRGGANPLATLEALGECAFHRGDPPLAARVLRRAAGLQGTSDPDLVGVHYWLGRCEEAEGRPTDARRCYQRVVAVDAAFRDAADRLRQLDSL